MVESAAAQIQIARLGTETLRVPVIGTSPLVVHKWSQKARTAMLDAQQGRKTPKQNRDPEQDYQESIYRTAAGEYGFPTLGFKAATVGAARFYGKSVRMTELRQFVFFNGVPADDGSQPLTVITGEPHMREDMVKVGMGGTDLRYRAEFTEWSAVLEVTFVKNAINRDSVLALIDAGGMGVGVGEWRPERKGEFGTYQLDESREIEVSQ